MASADDEPLIIGQYALFDALASGGMATVHLGRRLGPEGFGRTVAVKRLHSHFTTDPEFVTMFMDEVRIVARIRHPNVVAMVDVIESSQGLFLVMEYIHGESFSKLLRTCRSAGTPIPVSTVGAIMHGVLLGLHAAHETRGDDNAMLGVVHRDVSPQNIILGLDGVARVLDFGVAKAAGRVQVTREGQIKGKLAYMAPEQIRGKGDRRADVFAASVVLWESLTGRRLHEGARDVDIVTRVVKGDFPKPSAFRPDVSPTVDAIVMRGLAIDPEHRYPTALAMALDLERAVALASSSELGPWVESLAADVLFGRATRVAAMERVASKLSPHGATPPLAGSATGPYAPIPEARSALPGLWVPDPNDSASRSGASFGMPLGVAMAERGRDLTPLIGIVAFCVALALVGMGLGGWALHIRAAPGAAARGVPSAAPSSRVVLPIRSEATPAPVPLPEPAATEEQAPAPAPTPPQHPAVSIPPARAGVAAPMPPPPAPKGSCDPPFTTDAQGHKHYKLQCLDK